MERQAGEDRVAVQAGMVALALVPGLLARIAEAELHELDAIGVAHVECGGEIVETSDLGVALMVRDPDGQLIELLRAEYPASRPDRP